MTGTKQQTQPEPVSRTRSARTDAEAADRITALLAGRANYQEEVRRLVQKHSYVVFYGCGAILNSIVETWTERIGRPIDFCCDSDPAKWGQVFCGARCLSPDELVTIKDHCSVFVTIGQFRPVFDFLTATGFSAVNLLYKYDLVTSDYLDTHDPGKIAATLRQARRLFCDEQSLKVFDSILQRVLGGGTDPDLMVKVCEGDQYFPADIIRLSGHECFVDIGAFDGDTVRDFVSRTGARFDRVDAFEVNRVNYSQLTANVARMPGADRIKLFNLGIWDAECDVTYSIGKSQSTIGTGEATGHVVALDDVLRGERVSFIKMDIEGAEPNALRGARNIIQTQKPRLAICVYHHLTHLWEIPLYIKELVPDYKLYLRHHTNLEYETVCYAVR
jgi:FkbM family methyltransferase